jgi:hypothetical protein
MSRDQVSCNLDGETAILNLTKAVYYSLDPVGTRIWTLLQQPRTVNEICDTLVHEYEVTPDRCERDVLALLQQLVAEGLVEVQDEAAA